MPPPALPAARPASAVRALAPLLALALALAACGGGSGSGAGDAGDGPGDDGGDAADVEVLADTATAPDAGDDAGPDADDAGPDAPDAGPPDDTAGPPDAGPPLETGIYEAPLGTATVTVADRETLERTYVLSTTADLRDDLPPSKQVTYSELAGQPVLRSGHDLFDALFALAVEEARQDSVASISNGGFNFGQGVPCECFETGEKWTYVWTRDTAYAVDLGLAWLDPSRARASLDFKISGPKGGGPLQAVQDTGSGGSWPVSTDRVVWALGARAVLPFLDGAERAAFLDRAHEALATTADHDRAFVWDPADGLYRGEQSFLDWREQSYPVWTKDDTVHIAMSKALSTNVAHHVLLSTAAALAEEVGDATGAAKYGAWADALAEAVRAALWLPEEGWLSSFETTTLDPAPVRKTELLGASLAVLEGVVPPDDAATAVRSYPRSPMGPPVLWPQQPFAAVYHNRGIWPFVTAYGALAARAAGNAAVFDLDLESLVRGAALNLSNMENFEWLTQSPWIGGGPFGGPVVNSRRQLWSVAGYLGAIARGLFGLETSPAGLRFRPFVTPGVHARFLVAPEGRVTLHRFPWRGRLLDVTLVLPASPGAPGTGAYDVISVRLDGVEIGAAWLDAAALPAAAALEITLAASAAPGDTATVVPADADARAHTAPREPGITGLALDGGLVRVTWAAGGTDLVFSVYRDGVEVAAGLTDTTWLDPDSADHAARSPCYAVEAAFADTGLRSHHSPPVCWWGEGFARIQDLSIYHARANAGAWAEAGGKKHWADWGAPGDTLTVEVLRPRWTGPHLVQLVYGNGAGPINTGIACAVKHLTVEEVDTGAVVASGPVAMPQRVEWDNWGLSTFLPADLDAAKRYRLRVEDGWNMSYLEHFEIYNAGPGGGAGVYNRANVATFRLLPLSGTDHTPTTGALLPLDGQGDLDDFPEASRLVPGATLEAGDRFALTWDDDWIYAAVASPLFTSPYKAFSLYVEAAPGDLAPPAPGPGIEYAGLVPQLPFTPTHAVSVRALADDGSPGGPWNGVWHRAGGKLDRQRLLEPGVDWWLSADARVLAFRVSRDALGRPARLRLAAHGVNEAPANEWKDLVPPTHTPWAASATGYYELDLGSDAAVEGWQAK